MLIMEFYSLLIYPAVKEVRTIWQLSRKSTGKAVYFISAFIILVVCGVLFLPISWGINMYGESVPKWRIPVTVEEGGYLRHELSRGEKMVKEGEKIVSLSSPQLLLAIEKIKKMLAHDELLYELQSVDEDEFSQRALTEQKKVSDKIALNELERRKKLLDITAERSGFFVSLLIDLTKGAYLPRNTTIGEIVSSEIVIYGYSDDRDIGKIQIGLCGKVRFFL